MDRRRFLEALVAASIPLSASRADCHSPGDDEELIRFLIQESDRLGVPSSGAAGFAASAHGQSGEEHAAAWNPLSVDPGFQIMGEIINDIRENRLWWRKPDREPPAWAPLAESNDYAHLGAYSPPAEDFELSLDTLKFLIERNHFHDLGSNPRVLFGLRGCLIPNTDDATAWAPSHPLKWTLPNHMAPRCVLGVWDREADRLRLFPGSTVPEVSYMFLYRYAIAGCNLLPTGMYRYSVGTHRANSSNPQHGAFREADRVVVVRTGNDLIYKSNDPSEGWEVGRPADNIHAAHFYGRNSPPYYSSAGCQVVLGSHRNGRVSGPWAEFRRAAGLAATPGTSDDGRAYRYVLLTGLEGALAAGRSAEFVNGYERIRFGSSGDKARELQQRLNTVADGDFRSGSVLALIRRQKADAEFESGMFTLPFD